MNKFSDRFQDDIAAILHAVEALLPNPASTAQPPMPADPAASRFTALARIFRLGPAEEDMLRCLIAAHVEPRLRDRFAERTGFAYVTEYLVRALGGHGPEPIFASDSPLNIWQLVHARDTGPDTPLALELDLAVLEWLAGKPGLEPRLVRRLTRPEPLSRALGDRHAAGVAEFTQSLRSGQPLLCLLDPEDGVEVTDFLAAVAQQTGLTIWCVRGGAPFSDQDLLKVHRFARVQNAALYWEEPSLDCLKPALVPGAQFQFATRRTGLGLTRLAGHRHLTLPLSAPTRAELRQLLQSRFADADETTLTRAVATKGLTPRRIMDPAFTSIDALRDAQTTANAAALTDWAVPLPTTMRFDDLVLEPDLKDALRQFVEEIDAHATLWQDPEVARVYAQERALTALLQGPPGTGKTLTARILAGEAGLPLYRVDAASLTSKYIGETAENMRSLFHAANKSGAMLFIDEFEAIVGKRTETRNEIARSYNHDTAYFLQLIETQFEGVAIFATNRPMEIDEAMHRRIRKVFDFRLPDKEERKALWQRALLPFKPAGELLALSALLADSFAFSGSRIKAVVLNARALKPKGQTGIGVAQLRQAAMAEARANGRLPGKRELQQIASFGTATTGETEQ